MKQRMKQSLLLTMLAALAVSCGAYKEEVFKTVEPHETAFVIPLEGATKKGQKQFMSKEYLLSAKVAKKRINIPQRKKSTGRAWFSFKWIPTVEVITVDRTPVTREWTSDEGTGTNVKDESIPVESLDSIGFGIGINVTAKVQEEDTATFLYNYPSKSLGQIVDTNVRSFVQSELADEFGSLSLTKCKLSKKDIVARVREKTQKHFREYGITIPILGHTGGLTYENEKIQTAIDDAYVTEMDKVKATQEQEAQAIRNKTNEDERVSERKQAQQFGLAEKARTKMLRLEIEKIKAERWDGVQPRVVAGGNASFLFSTTGLK